MIVQDSEHDYGDLVGHGDDRATIATSGRNCSDPAPDRIVVFMPPIEDRSGAMDQGGSD